MERQHRGAEHGTMVEMLTAKVYMKQHKVAGLVYRNMCTMFGQDVKLGQTSNGGGQ